MIGKMFFIWVVGFGSVVAIGFIAKELFNLIKEFIEDEEWELLVIMCIAVGLVVALILAALGI